MSENFNPISTKDLINASSSDSQKTKSQPEIVIAGIPSSPGLAYGKATVIQPESVVIPYEIVAADEIDGEIERFETAINEVTKELYLVLSKIKSDSKNVYAVIETSLLFLTDTILQDSIKKRIKHGFSAESSIIQEFDYQKQYLLKARDSILRERAVEIDQIKERLLGVLRNRTVYYSVTEGSIVVAQSVTPGDLINFRESGVIAIVTEIGGISSHSSILARTFEIPEVIGIKEATSVIQTNDTLVIDGYTGTIVIHPDKYTLSKFEEKRNREEENKKKLGTLKNLPAITRDGVEIGLLSNIDFPKEVESAIMVGAQGIGLVRSEFLILQVEHLPDEEEQYEYYNNIVEQIYPNPVTIRIFDIGSDKFAEGMPRHENNPALGFRGIRFLLHRRDLLKTQLRAILRASHLKNVKMMIPMITMVHEVTDTIELLNECKAELENEKIFFDKNLPLGVMIETPASALIAKALAGYVNFFSIGTNDLTQYTLAADRTNELVTQLFDSFHPAVLKLMKMSIDAAKKAGISVSVCGDLAGHPAATALLIGLGVDELSVSPSILLEVKSRIRETGFKEAKKLARQILGYSTYNEVRRKLGMS